MAPLRTRKAKPDELPVQSSTPHRSPIKKALKKGISLLQKQALIDNLQLEITERARRLRAQYYMQAAQLRSRIQMRLYRVPTALRKMTIGELLEQSAQPPQPPRPPKSPYVAKPPPVPAKDGTSPKPVARKPVPATSGAPMRGYKRSSDEISGADKENQSEVESPKKRLRGAPPKTAAPLQPAQILSPTSSNARVLHRERPASPSKIMIGRPASPVKAPVKKPSSNILSSMVDKARATRPTTVTRKATTSSTTSSNPAPTTRTRKAAAAPPPPPSAAATRGRRKISATSEASDGSTATVIKKTTASRAAKAAPAPKRTVMTTIKSATTRKAPAPKAPPAASTSTGRTLRKRG
ncbi:hypothetical protein F4778DRAFT_751975 [Xylariomycetidae sp. FL2044]|nr:hypothetical protein F4778DRAFT_751975 [Xylariomycetidae sp. FL2044]